MRLVRRACRTAAVLALTAVALGAQPVIHDKTGYIGSRRCAFCHNDIAKSQAATYMAQTWRPISRATLAASEGPAPAVEYRFFPEDSREMYQVQLPGASAVKVPIEATIGVDRSTCLARVADIDGVPLARAALIEVRYYQLRDGGSLAPNPGTPSGKQPSYETALGRALSAGFEQRCRGCHGDPQRSPAHESGVVCETCHGPGQPHLDAISNGKPEGILNPGKLPGDKLVDFCGQCHSGFARVVDPRPADFIISNQVESLRNSECYIQSNAGITCLSCHNPHRQATANDPAYEKACLGCHASEARKAAVCPVNAKTQCISCHMPKIKRGTIEVTEHWIRVATASGDAHPATQNRSHIAPRRVYLRMILTRTAGEAATVEKQLANGEDFADLARRNSIDASASDGGYLGEIWIEKTDPAIAGAAGALAHGETSPPVPVRSGFAILRREPRDFRLIADSHVEKGSALLTQGDADGAMREFSAALAIYPSSLRALTRMGMVLGRQKQIPQALEYLNRAVRLWPDDPQANYLLGVAYGAAGRGDDEVAAYRRALDLDPDLTTAWFNLGSSLAEAHRPGEAVDAFLHGLDADPLAAALYYNLAVTYEQMGEHERARKALQAMHGIAPSLREP